MTETKYCLKAVNIDNSNNDLSYQQALKEATDE